MQLRVLVTGGAGFIGSALVRHLVGSLAATVLNVDKLTYAGDSSTVADVASSPRYRFARCDIADAPTLTQLFDSFQPDAVIHLAAESHVDRSIDGPAEFIQTNIVGTHVLLEVSLRYFRSLGGDRREAFRFLHISTDEVFGSLSLDDTGRFDELTRYAPNSPYAATKASSDLLSRAWNRTYGLPVIISNCSNNYGPFQFPEKLIPTMVIAGVEGRPLPVYGTGANVRDWLFVEDHVQALITLLERGQAGETYVIGGGYEKSNIELVHELCQILDELIPQSKFRPHRNLISFVKDRPAHDLRYAVDDRRMRSELSWRPLETLSTGLRKTVAWYLDNRVWWERLRRERYGGERLGLMTPK
jgi:dTDP-glucose 4,6-dehydratase